MVALERIWNIKLIEIKLKCEIYASKNTGKDNLELQVIQNADLDSKPDGNEIIDRMQVMELQRIFEDLPLNKWDIVTEVADPEVLPDQQKNQNIRDEHLSAEQMQVMPESSSSVMQVEDNKEIQSCKVEPDSHISSLKQCFIWVKVCINPKCRRGCRQRYYLNWPNIGDFWTD